MQVKTRQQATAGTPGETPIGVRLKDLRLQMQLTLSEVTARTGVSSSNLSKIENGRVSPSFDVIKRIADGLSIDLADLVRPGAKSPVSGRKTVTRLGEGARFTSGQYDYRAHATELSRKGMTPLEMRVRARSADDFDHWSSHRGEEFAFVLSGAIDVHSEHYAPFRLTAGESAYFDSGMKHVFVSVSEDDAHVLSISYDPDSLPAQVLRFNNPHVREIDEN